MHQQNHIWQFATASNIRFGRGSISLVPEELKRYGIKQPLIITDKTIVKLPAVLTLLQAIQESTNQASIYDECIPEPPTTVAEAASAYGRDLNVDGVVGIGGGSNLDVAKMVATILRHGGSPADYFGFDAIPGPVLPLIALPTTAGTGSEVSHSAVLTDPDKHVKVSTLSRWLRPTVAIIDPSLTDSCPPNVSAHSGIDALVHAIEAMTNRSYRSMLGVDPQTRAYEGSYPFTTMLAAEAIHLIGCSLVRVYQQPNDYEARDRMAMAAMLAGMAFSNSGVALVHAPEYPIGVLTHCSHGEGNGLLLPHVMRFNRDACLPSMAIVANRLGCDPSRMSTPESAADAAIEAVVTLQNALGIRTRLSQLGLHADQIPLVAQRAVQIKRLMDVNPRRPTEAELVAILERAY